MGQAWLLLYEGIEFEQSILKETISFGLIWKWFRGDPALHLTIGRINRVLDAY